MAGSATGCGLREFTHVETRVLNDDVRIVLGGGGNSLVLLSGPEALVVDPKFLTFGRALEQEVTGRLHRRVSRIVLTHSHGDHANAAGMYPGVGAVLAAPKTRERLVETDEGACVLLGRAKPPRSIFEPTDAVPFAQVPDSGDVPLCALPYVDVTADVHVMLGRMEVQVLPLGGHTDGDVAVYVPSQALLAAGDLVLVGWMPHLDEKAGGNPLTMAKSLEAMLALPFQTLVPGHGPVGGRADVELALAYLKALEEDVRRLSAAGAGEDAVAAQVTLRPEFSGLKPIPGDSHGKNARLMFRAVQTVQEEGKGTP